MGKSVKYVAVTMLAACCAGCFLAQGQEQESVAEEARMQGYEAAVSSVRIKARDTVSGCFRSQVSDAVAKGVRMPERDTVASLVAEYEADIRKVSEALLSNAWDEESGYFGYVLHDPSGEKTEIFRTPEGENYNRGVDGVTPLIAGVCSDSQERRMMEHLKSEKELWTNVGISTVDQSAPYYNDNGYWNGAVWFPYQYLLWRSMLDTVI